MVLGSKQMQCKYIHRNNQLLYSNYQVLGHKSFLLLNSMYIFHSIIYSTIFSRHDNQHHFCHFLLSMQDLLLEPSQSSFMHPWACTLADQYCLSPSPGLVLIQLLSTHFLYRLHSVAIQPLQSCPSFGT